MVLGTAVAAARGWADITSATSDDKLLRRLLALNLQRAATQGAGTQHAALARQPSARAPAA